MNCLGCSGVQCLRPDRVFLITGVALDMTVKNASALLARPVWIQIWASPARTALKNSQLPVDSTLG
jgi:hypothetical protein